MAEPVDLMVGFVYSVVYETALNGVTKTLIAEGELLSFNDDKIVVKGAKGSLEIRRCMVSQLTRK